MYKSKIDLNFYSQIISQRIKLQVQNTAGLLWYLFFRQIFSAINIDTSEHFCVKGMYGPAIYSQVNNTYNKIWILLKYCAAASLKFVTIPEWDLDLKIRYFKNDSFYEPP